MTAGPHALTDSESEPIAGGSPTGAAERDYIARNRAAWERWAPHYKTAGRRAWNEPEPRWGMWGSLESDLALLRACKSGMNAIELGCGNGSVCAWLTRAGLHPVGVDFANAQLESARLFQEEFGVRFRLEPGNAESVRYENGGFDLVLSEYGASVWCDPYRWVPEAARLLRAGGLLIFMVTSPTLTVCTTDDGVAGTKLERPYFGMHRFEFAGEGVVEFHLGHGEWFQVLRDNGFTVENLIEVRPIPHAAPHFPFATNDWARDWPSEDIWIARRR